MKNLLFLVLLGIAFNTKADVYNIKDYGAVEGQLSTKAIQQAVDECSARGGGMVLVPSGRYVTGTIELKSHVNLHLQEGAVLEGSENLQDYTTSDRVHGIIYCYDAQHISITGQGVIDAHGTFFYDTTVNHTYQEFNKQVIRQKDDYMPEGEFYSDGPIKRKVSPGMTVTFYHCSSVVLKDITIKDTPLWAVRFAYCDDVLVSGISIYNNLMVPNSDGVHCTSSRNIRVSDCDIRAGDDAFIVTGFTLDEETPGYNTTEQLKYSYGNKTGFAENITVTNCTFQSRSAGIRVGYGQHPIRNCVFNNIIIYESNRGIGVFAHDAAPIENLIFSNFVIQTRLHNGQWWGNGEPVHLSAITRFENEPTGTIKNVQFNNITGSSEAGILVYGDKSNSIQSISFNNINLKIVKGKETMAYGGNFDLRPAAEIDKQLYRHDIPGIYALNVNGLEIHDFKLEWGDDLPSFFTDGIECNSVNDLSIRNFTGSANPNSPEGKRERLVETTIRK
jgi:polygalacturonase